MGSTACPRTHKPITIGQCSTSHGTINPSAKSLIVTGLSSLFSTFPSSHFSTLFSQSLILRGTENVHSKTARIALRQHDHEDFALVRLMLSPDSASVPGPSSQRVPFLTCTRLLTRGRETPSPVVAGRHN